MIAGAATASTTPTRIDRSSASHIPWSPWRAASRCSPTPTRRATAPVVPYTRNTNRKYDVSSTLDATPSPASWSVPRWPTTAVSTRTYSGSATSARTRGSPAAVYSRSSVPIASFVAGSSARASPSGSHRPCSLRWRSAAIARGRIEHGLQSTGVLARRRPVSRTKTAPTSTGTMTAAARPRSARSKRTLVYSEMTECV